MGHSYFLELFFFPTSLTAPNSSPILQVNLLPQGGSSITSSLDKILMPYVTKIPLSTQCAWDYHHLLCLPHQNINSLRAGTLSVLFIVGFSCLEWYLAHISTQIFVKWIPSFYLIFIKLLKHLNKSSAEQGPRNTEPVDNTDAIECSPLLPVIQLSKNKSCGANAPATLLGEQPGEKWEARWKLWIPAINYINAWPSKLF